MKTAFVIKPSGTDAESRHSNLLKELILPVCQTLDYQLLVTDPAGSPFKILDPVVSPVYTSSLVIVDLGLCPHDPLVLMGAGYRRGTGRSIIYIIDPATKPKELGLPLTQCVAYEPDSLDWAQEQLQTAIELGTHAQSAWESHFGFLESQHPVDDMAKSKYTYVNQVAAQILGYDSPEKVIGKLCVEVDQNLDNSMFPAHFKEFCDDQDRMSGQLSNKQADFLAEVPMWFNNAHKVLRFKNKLIWPVITQHRIENGCWYLRQAWIDISSWAKRALSAPRESAIRLPRDFCPQAPPYDLFLSYSTVDRGIVLELFQHLQQLGLIVWMDCMSLNAKKPLGRDIAIAMQDSRALAIVIGENGLGPYQSNLELGVELDRRIMSNEPFLTLLLPGISKDNLAQFVPPEFLPKLQTRLVVSVDPDGGHLSGYTASLVNFLVQIIRGEHS